MVLPKRSNLALIGDEALFDYIEKNRKGIISLDNDAIEEVVDDSLNVKIGIVSRDENEKGERRKLNFGHTIGHAIEKTTGRSHGEAISIGMVIGAKLSERKGTLTGEDVERIETLLSHFKLPIKLKVIRKLSWMPSVKTKNGKEKISILCFSMVLERFG